MKIYLYKIPSAKPSSSWKHRSHSFNKSTKQSTISIMYTIHTNNLSPTKPLPCARRIYACVRTLSIAFTDVNSPVFFLHHVGKQVLNVWKQTKNSPKMNNMNLWNISVLERTVILWWIPLEFESKAGWDISCPSDLTISK